MKRSIQVFMLFLAGGLMACSPAEEDSTVVEDVVASSDTASSDCPVADDAGRIEIAPGLIATILTRGEGEPAARGDLADVNASLWLYDEQADDNKGNFIWESGAQPFRFELGADGLISGWNMGIECMLTGEKRDLIIPAELAYGEDGRAPMVPPNAALFYTLELVSLNAAAQ